MIRGAGASSETREVIDGQQWHGYSSRHFVIYTAGAGSAGLETLQRLERLRLFFEKANLIENSSESKLQLIAFNSEKEYSLYRINPGACAFYQRTPSSDFIVMQDLATEHSEVAMHEYTHFVFEHAGFKLPLWLSEGLADLYSSTVFRDNLAIVGANPADREVSLGNQSLLDLTTLITINADSPYYRESEKMALFYAQSWAITHMLAISRDYSAGFSSFLKLISAGVPAPESFQTAYHKSLAQISSDLDVYIHRNRWPEQTFRYDPTTTDTFTKLETAQAQVDLALAEIAAANPQKRLSAQASLQSFALKYPDNPKPEERLGYLALQENRFEDARLHFAAAVGRHSTEPEVIFYLAHLNLTRGVSREESISLLERVLELRPEHYNARLELGFAATKEKRFETAAAALSGIKDLQTEHAYAVYYTLAYCYTQLNNDASARSYAVRAQRAATNLKDSEQAANLLRFVGEASTAETAVR